MTYGVVINYNVNNYIFTMTEIRQADNFFGNFAITKQRRLGQASLCIYVHLRSPEPSLLTYTKYGCRMETKIRHLDPLDK